MSFDDTVEHLKAIAEPTRLRLLALLRDGDLSVKDLTQLVGQSQPRLSRHLKILADAGWITRHPEGAWVYFRLSSDGARRHLLDSAFALAPGQGSVLSQDADRLQRLKSEQREAAGAFFDENAARWDALRANLVDQGDLEGQIVHLVGAERVDRLLDLGTGTGRMLVLLKDLYREAIGIDTSHAMLRIARASLAEHGIDHAQVRQGDAFSLSVPPASQDLVMIHQVMHFFDDPRPLLQEAARVLAPGGRVVIIDFEKHDLEDLRRDHQHRRLGFESHEVKDWLVEAGLHVDEFLRLESKEKGPAKTLPVCIWTARDPRMVLDAPLSTQSTQFA